MEEMNFSAMTKDELIKFQEAMQAAITAKEKAEREAAIAHLSAAPAIDRIRSLEKEGYVVLYVGDSNKTTTFGFEQGEGLKASKMRFEKLGYTVHKSRVKNQNRENAKSDIRNLHIESFHCNDIESMITEAENDPQIKEICIIYRNQRSSGLTKTFKGVYNSPLPLHHSGRLSKHDNDRLRNIIITHIKQYGNYINDPNCHIIICAHIINHFGRIICFDTLRDKIEEVISKN